MDQFLNIFSRMHLSSFVSFERIAQIRKFVYNGGQNPVENAPHAGMNVDWELYARVLEAKRDRLIND